MNTYLRLDLIPTPQRNTFTKYHQSKVFVVGISLPHLMISFCWSSKKTYKTSTCAYSTKYREFITWISRDAIVCLDMTLTMQGVQWRVLALCATYMPYVILSMDKPFWKKKLSMDKEIYKHQLIYRVIYQLISKAYTHCPPK